MHGIQNQELQTSHPPTGSLTFSPVLWSREKNLGLPQGENPAIYTISPGIEIQQCKYPRWCLKQLGSMSTLETRL